MGDWIMLGVIIVGLALAVYLFAGSERYQGPDEPWLDESAEVVPTELIGRPFVTGAWGADYPGADAVQRQRPA